MKTDHRQSSAGRQAVGKLLHRRPQRAQFVVYRDSQGLERPRGRIDPLPRARPGNAAADDIGHLGGGANRLARARGDDVPSDAPAEAFLSILIDQVGQLFFVQSSQQLPGRLADVRVESQVQWPFGVEAEPSPRIGQLVAGKSQVQQDAVDRGDLQLTQHLGQLSIIGMDQLNRQPRQAAFGCGQRRRIAVQRHDQARGSHAPGKTSRVATGAQRAVDEGLACSGIERGHDLVA